MAEAVKIQNISKSYNNRQALCDISFNIEEGEIFGIIGPDGAGKTSLIRIVNTLVLADSGHAYVFGFNVIKDYKAIRQIMGYMPGRFSLYQDLSVEENIRFFATIYNTKLEENYDLIKRIYAHLEPFKNRRAGNLSGGMKQKLALCCALIHKPKILFLDEPTTGVDPVSRKEFWEILLHLKTQGMTTFVSTPYMDEAMRCDRVALINNGNILSIGKPDDLKHNHKKKVFAISSKDRIKAIQFLREYENNYLVYPFGEVLHYIDIDENANTKRIDDYLKKCRLLDFYIEEIQPNIEDTFILLTFNKNEQ